MFRQARQLTTWHYQWMILHEFLPLFIGQALVNEILADGRRFYRPAEAVMPVEFQGAVYRFGHSMVRPSYRANLAGDNGQAFFGMIFDPAAKARMTPLICAVVAARRAASSAGKRSSISERPSRIRTVPIRRSDRQALDTKLSTRYSTCRSARSCTRRPDLLPQRNLLRHVTWQLPSGQSIAEAMNVPALSRRPERTQGS